MRFHNIITGNGGAFTPSAYGPEITGGGLGRIPIIPKTKFEADLTA